MHEPAFYWPRIPNNDIAWGATDTRLKGPETSVPTFNLSLRLLAARAKEEERLTGSGPSLHGQEEAWRLRRLSQRETGESTPGLTSPSSRSAAAPLSGRSARGLPARPGRGPREAASGGAKQKVAGATRVGGL